MLEEHAKKSAALKAIEWVKPEMVIGLGSGTTTYYFTQELGKRCQQGLHIQAVASSSKTWNLAKEWGIPLLNAEEVDRLDLTVDGADEVDPQKRMIKGRGGALVREKILANMSQVMIVIIDESKCVAKLGKQPLPVEIIPFGAEATRRNLEEIGFQGAWRQTPEQTRYLTDNGNYILDIGFDHLRDAPEMDHVLISEIPGVVDTGFFFDLADHCIIGYVNGEVEVWS